MTIREHKGLEKLEDSKDEEENKVICKERHDEKVEISKEILNKNRYGRIVK